MFKFIKSLWWFVKKNWFKYVRIVIVGLILTVINLIPAYIVRLLTEAVDTKTLTMDFLFYKIIIPYVVTMFLIYFVTTTKRVFQNRLKVRLYYALQVKYVENILIQDATFFERYQSGDLLTRALGDVKQVNFSGGNRLLNIFLEFMTVVMTFIAMSLISWKLALLCMIPLSMIFVTNLLLRAKVKRNWKMVREKSSEMGNVILESITNVRTIRAYTKEEENYQKNLMYSKETYEIKTYMKGFKYTFFTILAVEIIAGIIFILTML